MRSTWFAARVLLLEVVWPFARVALFVALCWYGLLYADTNAQVDEPAFLPPVWASIAYAALAASALTLLAVFFGWVRLTRGAIAGAYGILLTYAVWMSVSAQHPSRPRSSDPFLIGLPIAAGIANELSIRLRPWSNESRYRRDLEMTPARRLAMFALFSAAVLVGSWVDQPIVAMLLVLPIVHWIRMTSPVLGRSHVNGGSA